MARAAPSSSWSAIARRICSWAISDRGGRPGRESEEIERAGLERWAAREDVPVERAFQTLITGLAVRYFTAVAGEGR